MCGVVFWIWSWLSVPWNIAESLSLGAFAACRDAWCLCSPWHSIVQSLRVVKVLKVLNPKGNHVEQMTHVLLSMHPATLLKNILRLIMICSIHQGWFHCLENLTMFQEGTRASLPCKPADIQTWACRLGNDLTHIVDDSRRLAWSQANLLNLPKLEQSLNNPEGPNIFSFFSLTEMIISLNLSVSLGGSPQKRTSKPIAVASCRKAIAIVTYPILSSLVLRCALSLSFFA